MTDQRSPAPPRPARRDQLERLLEEAELLAGAGRFDEALQRLGRAAAIAPGDARVHRHLAGVLVRADKPGDALRAAETAIGLAPGHPAGHRLRAFALLGLGRQREALAAAHQAHRLAPEDTDVLGVLVSAELANRRHKEAQAVALRLLELAPESPVAHEAVGEVALATRRWDQAEQAYRTLLRLEPTSADGLNNLALTCAARGDDEGAIGIYVRALTTDPSYSPALDNLLSTADRFLWGRWLRIPREPRGIAWFTGAAVLLPKFIAIFFLLHVLWFPVRLLRALRRWQRIPPQARDPVGEHQRRLALDVAATWGLAVSTFLAILAAVTQAGDPTSGGAAAWGVALGIGAAVGIVVSLSRTIPRVLRLDWPTRRRPTPRRTSPWEQTVRL